MIEIFTEKEKEQFKEDMNNALKIGIRTIIDPPHPAYVDKKFQEEALKEANLNGWEKKTLNEFFK